MRLRENNISPFTIHVSVMNRHIESQQRSEGEQPPYLTQDPIYFTQSSPNAQQNGPVLPLRGTRELSALDLLLERHRKETVNTIEEKLVSIAVDTSELRKEVAVVKQKQERHEMMLNTLMAAGSGRKKQRLNGIRPFTSGQIKTVEKTLRENALT